MSKNVDKGCRYRIINVTAIDTVATLSRLTVIKSNKLRTLAGPKSRRHCSELFLPFCGRFSIEFQERKSTSILNVRPWKRKYNYKDGG